mmetsp:Transcript_4787/g.14027  ORF Transcript_4787/g.14027 Transcript_4787/m.14027 type:complete len:1071 (+) Transcript_4787:122-3334(+)
MDHGSGSRGTGSASQSSSGSFSNSKRSAGLAETADLARGLAAAGLKAASGSDSPRSGSVVSEGRDHVEQAMRLERDNNSSRSSRTGSASNSAGGSGRDGSLVRANSASGSYVGSDAMEETMHKAATGGSGSHQGTSSSVTSGSGTGRPHGSGSGSGAGYSSSSDDRRSTGRISEDQRRMYDSSGGHSSSSSGLRSGSQGSGVGSQSSSGFQQLQALCNQYFSEGSTLPLSAKQAQLEDVVADLQRQHKQEMEQLKATLEAAQAREAKQNKEALQLEEQIEQLQGGPKAGQGSTAKVMVQQLQASRETQIVAEQERDDIKDIMKGMEAKLQVKVERIQSEIKASKKEQEVIVDATEERIRKVKEVGKEEAKLLKQQAKEKNLKLQTASAERDVLRRGIQQETRVHQNEVENLKAELAEVRAEIIQQKYEYGSKEDTRMAHELAETQEANNNMQSEMQELRLQMWELELGKGKKQASLVVELETVQDKIEEEIKGVLPLGKKKKSRKNKLQAMTPIAMAGGLTSIDEEDGDNQSVSGSCAGSGIVSSSGHDEVGDLGDFDGEESSDEEDEKAKDAKHEQLVNELLHELAEEHRQHLEYQEQVAAEEATEASKKDRLQSKVYNMRLQKTQTAADLIEQQAELDETLVHKEREIRKKQDKQNQLQNDIANARREQERASEFILKEEEAFKNEIEEIRRKLYQTLDTTRASEQRMQAAKHETQMMHEEDILQYETKVADLKEKARELGFDDTVDADDGEGELGQTHMIASLREERNELQHKLEWKEVQWKDKLDTMELQYASDVAKLKKTNDQELNQLKEKFDQEISELNKSIEDLEQMSQQGEAEPGAASEVSRALPDKPTRSLLSVLSLFRCPTRADAGGSTSQSAFCQAMCWHVLNSVPEVTALLCELKDLQISSVSKKAYKVWGGSSLHGHRLLSLVHSREEATWLEKAIDSNQKSTDLEKSEVGGFLVRELGCLAFRSRNGECFDSITTTVHMPEEPACGKGKAVIVILHPLLDEDEEPHRRRTHSTYKDPQDKHGSIRGLGRHSGVRSEVSDDVAPSDSVSRVAERRYI